MTTPTDTGQFRTPVPPGWPGDDPTVPDQLGTLGARHRPAAREIDLRPDRPRRPQRPRPGHGPEPAREAEAPPVAAPPRRRPEPDVEPEPAFDPGPEVDLDAVTGGHEIPVDTDDAARGDIPAGRVLVILVATLVLAMLVNADALVAKAEQKPLGPGRDRALAVWRPVQDVSHVLQLYRIRQVADWATGDDHAHRGGSAVPRAHPTARATTTTAPATGGAARAGTPAAPAALRTPTAAKPLRLWVGGDSLAQVFGQSLVTASTRTGRITPKLHYEISSGLSRPDFYDWPGALADDLKAQRPDVVVVMLGANDAQGLVLPGGGVAQDVTDPRWSGEYRRRVGAVMDQLKAGGRLVVWVGMPPMRGATFDSRMKIVNQAFAAEAATRPWVAYIDPAPVVGGPGGRFADLVPDAHGTPVSVRQGDGIHLSRAGGDRLAAKVLAVVEAKAHMAPR
jgi:uncharacterized protein